MIECHETPLSELEQLLGYVFQDKSLLVKALTHPTFAHENMYAGEHYERLEFLGDAVVGLFAAKLLFSTCNTAAEGELSRVRARMVRWESLADLAETLTLRRFLRMGDGQRRNGGGASRRMLADCFEALIGSVFLDAGFDKAEAVFAPMLVHVLNARIEEKDYKTLLQEVCHKYTIPAPQYVVVSIEGPDHARLFTCEVAIRGEIYGRGTASSKKQAEQRCAAIALEKMTQKDTP